MLTDGIRGAMVVGRIWGSPCPSSFWTWNNTAQVSPGTPMLVPWVQHPPQTNTTPGSACAGLALPCQRPVSTARPSRRGRSRSRAHQRVCRGQHGQPHVRTSRLHLLCLLDGKETTVPQGPVPPSRQRRALVPCRDVSGPGGCPHPSPGTVGWRRRGHHRQRAIPNPPAAQCNDQRDGFRREPAPSPSSAVPGPNPARCQLPGLEPRPPSLRGTPRGILGAWYQEAAPAGGGPEVGTAPFPHVDQAPLGHGAARLQHQLLGPEDPRLALGGMERFTAQPGRVGQLDGLGGLPAAAVRTHPEICVGVRGLRLRDVSIWRAQRGWGGHKVPWHRG